MFNIERGAGNYRFLSSHYDIWFNCQFMSLIEFYILPKRNLHKFCERFYFESQRTFVDSLNRSVK
ncbi:hypothetical protein DBY68_013655 [Pseudocitrobacter sp. RIT415]|nr:hypothetical protein DBY68_013655 [Pseudocitrobacter sp. RIT 415]